MASEETLAVWAATEADLRWILARGRVTEDCAAWVATLLDNNEMGEAYDVLRFCLQEPSTEVVERMHSVAVRLGLKPGDIPAR